VFARVHIDFSDSIQFDMRAFYMERKSPGLGRPPLYELDARLPFPGPPIFSGCRRF